jgi:hypothetical protein
MCGGGGGGGGYAWGGRKKRRSECVVCDGVERQGGVGVVCGAYLMGGDIGGMALWVTDDGVRGDG